jgi:hypothetical protein
MEQTQPRPPTARAYCAATSRAASAPSEKSVGTRITGRLIGAPPGWAHRGRPRWGAAPPAP